MDYSFLKDRYGFVVKVEYIDYIQGILLEKKLLEKFNIELLLQEHTYTISLARNNFILFRDIVNIDDTDCTSHLIKTIIYYEKIAKNILKVEKELSLMKDFE